MYYQLKQESKSYDYIRNIAIAERREIKRYQKRLSKACGFEVKSFSGRSWNQLHSRDMVADRIIVTPEEFEHLDKNVWRKRGAQGDRVFISPVQGTVQGKMIQKAIDSFKPVVTHDDIMKELGLKAPEWMSEIDPIGIFVSPDSEIYLHIDAFIDADNQNQDLIHVSERAIKDKVNLNL